MSNFRPVDRETGFLLPPSVEEWLPERHLARFVVEVIEQLDLSAFVKAYRGSGSASYHPSMLLGLLVYGYATGVFSSRKLERATYDSVAFRFIAVNDHPDHDTIAAFRRRFLDRIEGLFVEVLLLAREAGVLKLGTVALDGTKVHANASRHSALSWKHACELVLSWTAFAFECTCRLSARPGRDTVVKAQLKQGFQCSLCVLYAMTPLPRPHSTSPMVNAWLRRALRVPERRCCCAPSPILIRAKEQYC